MLNPEWELVVEVLGASGRDARDNRPPSLVGRTTRLDNQQDLDNMLYYAPPQ